MDDLISRQALRDAMYHEAFEVDSELQKWDGGCWIRYKMFENVIDKIPSAQQWIPCSERLPDQNGKYLVVGRQKAINILKFDGGRWYGKWGVVAWMPLPEPYKGEEK